MGQGDLARRIEQAVARTADEDATTANLWGALLGNDHLRFRCRQVDIVVENTERLMEEGAEPKAASREAVEDRAAGVLAEDTADMAMALILAVPRRLPEGAVMMQRGEFYEIPAPFELPAIAD